MAKSAKSAPAATEEAPVKPKSKRMVLVILGLLVLAGISGGALYFMQRTHHEEVPKEKVVEPPSYFVMEPFIVNLQSEESEKALQVGITLKLPEAVFADKIRAALPEIRNGILILLSSKRASDLISPEGKMRLAHEIVVGINPYVGIRNSEPKQAVAMTQLAESGVQVSPLEASAEPASAPKAEGGSGKIDVLFTSFIIQ